MPVKRRPLADLFWPKVDKDGPLWNGQPCWIWTGSINANGYGQTGGSKTQLLSRLAHRVAYVLLAGPIPEGLTLDHLCRKRSCVNPAHLDPVPNRVNVLRGESLSAQNARKTHCINGHLFDEENTRTKNGTRECRLCGRDKQRILRARRSAENGPRMPKTHCPHGHEYTSENSRYYYDKKRGITTRTCIECIRIHSHEWYMRHKGATA